MSNQELMTLALQLAKQAADKGEAPIGCLIVQEGRIVGRGYNRREIDRSALAHAEILAIEEACATVGSWRLARTTLVVTLEPCPMCAGAIANARIPRVVFGAYDTKAGAYGGLFDLNTLGVNHRPDVVGGVMSTECGAMLSDFFAALRQKGSHKKDF